jgi:transcriptional regulator with XRE-family HTH domain
MKDKNENTYLVSSVRNSLKLTQDQFAQLLGYSKAYLKDIEYGRVKPSRRFLESLQKTCGVSIDAIISSLGRRVANTLDKIPANSGYGFVFVYDFTDSGLIEAEKQILEFIGDRPHLIIDGAQVKSSYQLYTKLTGLKEPISKMVREFRAQTIVEYKYFIIKNISKSMMGHKAQTLRYIASNFGEGNGALIVIDKPSFLERNAEILYYWAYPIQVSHWGKMHAP